jgi:hypothetical protein
MRPDTLRVLQAADHEGQWERPDGFDHQGAIRRFDAFLADLEQRLGRHMRADTGSSLQDCSFHAEVFFDGGLLRFSNFGNLAAFTPDHAVRSDVVDLVSELLLRHGYTFLPDTSELEEPYRPVAEPPPGGWTWWIRYFDYL